MASKSAKKKQTPQDKAAQDKAAPRAAAEAGARTLDYKSPPVRPAPVAGDLSLGRAVAGWLFPAYLAVIFLGYLLLRAPGAMLAGGEMGAVRALFTAVNAATLTGFPQALNVDKYETLGKATVFGLILSGSLFSLIIGGMAAARILRLRHTDPEVVRAALAAESIALLVGAAFFLFDKERTLGQSLFLAASAFGNCGLVMGHAPEATGWQTHLVVLPLVALGGFGLPVLMELFDWAVRRKPPSAHTRTVLGLAAWFYVGGTVLLVALRLGAENAPSEAQTHAQLLRDLVASSAATAVNSRTAGLPLDPPGRMSKTAVWAVIGLMAAGAGSAGTGGGIKTTTLAEVFRGVRRALAGESPGRPFGVAATWVGGYLLLVGVCLLLLLHGVPEIAADRSLFNAVSAASNVGLTHEPINLNSRANAYILSGTMLVGRFAPLMILWWMADTTTGADLAVG